jgi:acetolactate synthase-1/2/3 large subunit
MNKTGAWLVRYALEQLGIQHTFGIPGIANAEIYDQLDQSSQITTHLVNHKMSAAFMADALSRTSAGTVGTMLISSGAAITHSTTGIGEAFLAGIPMLVISGSTDYQASSDHHESIDQQQLLKSLTKAQFKISDQQKVVATLFKAYNIATSDKPGPVFVDIPLSIQIPATEIDQPLPIYLFAANQEELEYSDAEISSAAKYLLEADRPGILVGWGGVDAQPELIALAEQLGAPVSTTLSGISSFPAKHPQHVGMIFGPAAVLSAQKPLKNATACSLSAPNLAR